MNFRDLRRFRLETMDIVPEAEVDAGGLPLTRMMSDANPVGRLTAIAALPKKARLILD